MNVNKIQRFVSILMLEVGFVIGSLGLAHATTDKASLEDVKNEVAEAAESIKRYSVEQRDEALDIAKAVMDSLDAKIDRFQSSIEENWDKLDKAARRRAIMTLDELHEQRRRLTDSYIALKGSSAGAWGDVKKGFSASYMNLHEAWNKAEDEFNNSK